MKRLFVLHVVIETKNGAEPVADTDFGGQAIDWAGGRHAFNEDDVVETLRDMIDAGADYNDCPWLPLKMFGREFPL